MMGGEGNSNPRNRNWHWQRTKRIKKDPRQEGVGGRGGAEKEQRIKFVNKNFIQIQFSATHI